MAVRISRTTRRRFWAVRSKVGKGIVQIIGHISQLLRQNMPRKIDIAVKNDERSRLTLTDESNRYPCLVDAAVVEGVW
jgi:hypothetical protein